MLILDGLSCAYSASSAGQALHMTSDKIPQSARHRCLGEPFYLNGHPRTRWSGGEFVKNDAITPR